MLAANSSWLEVDLETGVVFWCTLSLLLCLGGTKEVVAGGGWESARVLGKWLWAGEGAGEGAGEPAGETVIGEEMWEDVMWWEAEDEMKGTGMGAEMDMLGGEAGMGSNLGNSEAEIPPGTATEALLRIPRGGEASVLIWEVKKGELGLEVDEVKPEVVEEVEEEVEEGWCMRPAEVEGRSERLPNLEGRELKPVESEFRRCIPRGVCSVLPLPESFFVAN